MTEIAREVLAAAWRGKLTGIQERYGRRRPSPTQDDLTVSSEDIAGLLAFAGAALELVVRWERAGNGWDAQSQCAAQLRDAAARTLLGKEGS
jgi:hypothetical protein